MRSDLFSNRLKGMNLYGKHGCINEGARRDSMGMETSVKVGGCLNAA